jgi:archaetidylinositol phosphate synthase
MPLDSHIFDLLGSGRIIMEQQKSYTRVQQSWLAANERVVLVLIATSLPRWVKPDHLTILGVGGSLLCGLGFAASSFSPNLLWLVPIGLVVNWAGDSLDGSLARVRKTERPRYGFFVDHTSDIVSQVLIFMGLALSPYVRFETGCLLLMSYWLAAMFTFIRTIAVQVFQISYFGIGPTEIRIGLMAYVFSLLTIGPLPVATRIGALSLMDILAIVIFATVPISFTLMILSEARRISAMEASPVVPPVKEGASPSGIAPPGIAPPGIAPSGIAPPGIALALHQRTAP